MLLDASEGDLSLCTLGWFVTGVWDSSPMRRSCVGRLECGRGDEDGEISPVVFEGGLKGALLLSLATPNEVSESELCFPLRPRVARASLFKSARTKYTLWVTSCAELFFDCPRANCKAIDPRYNVH